jgi:L-fucose mutarotase
MLHGTQIHPEILDALGRAGHGSQILIADGNYPFATGANRHARRVFLNLSPGILSVTDILRVLVSAVPIESAAVMLPADGTEPPIFADFRDLLPGDMSLTPIDRFGFYEAARREDVALVIATGEQRIYANILLTIGVIPPTPA